MIKEAWNGSTVPDLDIDGGYGERYRCEVLGWIQLAQSSVRCDS
jgi:hypothetical protein